MPFAPHQFTHVAGHGCVNELNFLLSAVETSLAPPSAKPASPGATGPVDPLRLIELARLNKLINVLPDKAEALPEGCGGLVAQIGQARLLSAMMNQRGLEAAAGITRLLTAQGIDHVHLKGPLQQVELYGSYHQKPSADTDLLVRPADRLEAGRVIQDEGYRAKDSQIALWWRLYLHERHFDHPERGTMIDLHHGLHQPGVPRPRNTESFLDTARDMTFQGTTFRIPDARHRVLLASISIVKAIIGREPALSAVVDLRAAHDKLTPEDRRSMMPLARALRLERVWMFAMRFVEAVFPAVPMPDFDDTPALPGLEADTLRAMIATPWVEDLPWLRRHLILSDLCGKDRLRYMHESAQSVLSGLFRKSLEMRASLKGKAE
ncbi:hypothetical protein LCGC14_0497650 [marine sediment metagenome]|uniref:Nucleotidyltransferase family protein n=1 Tax=marine sediment metagenome TaxID=412755 RepID=A0A0F9S4S1_9ZZZZ